MLQPTTIQRHARAKEIFLAALELGPSERAGFVRLECGDDEVLCREVEALVAADGKAGDWFRLPEAETVSDHDGLKGQVVGGYRLISELGVGGMGVVFLAEKDDAGFHRQVALKLIKSDLHSKAVIKRFNLERQILSSLEHPNIARLIDGGASESGLPYFVMEYVDGVPLIEYAESKELALDKRLELFREVCAAVSYAHKRAVIHRDLKPSNILVTPDGNVKLLDFGIAKLLSSDSLAQPEGASTFHAMTPEFASPEQVRREIVTTVSDVYSLGVVLYELLAGSRPYSIDSKNLVDIISTVCDVEPLAPSRALRDAETTRREGAENSDASSTSSTTQVHRVSPSQVKGDLDNIVMKALRKEPDRRYSTVEALSEDLRRHQVGLPVSARSDTFAYRAEKFVRRNRIPAAIAALGILILLGGIVATLWQARRAEQERAKAERRFNDVRVLVNSFMFELNDEILKGQTQGRELVVKRALEYLDKLSGEAKDDASLQRDLAVAFLKIGDIQRDNRGSTDGALDSYQKARTILEELNTIDPLNLEIMRELGTAYQRVGSTQGTRTLDNDNAVDTLHKARALCESLLVNDPKNPDNRRLLTDVYKSLGDALRKNDERLVAHRKALSLREELLELDPSNTEDIIAVASMNKSIGLLLLADADKPEEFRTVLEHFDKALAIYEKLQAADPDNASHRRNLADVAAIRMRPQAGLGNKPGVISSFAAAMTIFKALAATDPKHMGARLDIAYTHHHMCLSMLKLNDTDRGIRACRDALRIGESLFAADPTNGAVYNLNFVSYRSIAAALKKSGATDEVVKTYQRSLTLAERWLDVQPNYWYSRYNAATTCLRLGEANTDLALQTKFSAAKKKGYWAASRHWFGRARDYFIELQRLEGEKQDYSGVLREIEQETARCDAALLN